MASPASQIVIWIRAGAELAALEDTVRSVDLHSAPGISVVISGQPSWRSDLGGSDRPIRLLAHGESASSLAPADIVLLAAGCRVAAGWLAGLHDAAYCDSTVASAAPLSTTGLPGFDPGRFTEVAAELRARSLRIRPRDVAGFRGCAYIRRTALELAGGLDDGFWEKALAQGLFHVVADDVLVQGVDAPAGRDEPLARAARVARQVVAPLRLLIDGRIPDPQPTGTHRHISELIAALVQARQAPIRVLAGADARAALSSIDGAELVDEQEALAQPADVIHRPLQVAGEWELITLPRLGERVIITQHDMIGYRNPAYFSDRHVWLDYRARTRAALAIADHVVFPSAHARLDALADDLISPERATVIPNGVDHVRHAPGEPPSQLEHLPAGRELIVCLGSDYAHKNRLFALRMLKALIQEHNWQGSLVLAGPHITPGGSVEEEVTWLEADEQLRAATIDLGSITETEKAWLLSTCKLVLYPTTYEGFGLIPFEAAAYGVPCMWASTTSLAELLGAENPPITMWDSGLAAASALALIRDQRVREGNLARIRRAAEGLTWQAAAHRLLDIYAQVSVGSRSPGGALARVPEQWRISADAWRLVGPGGTLPRDLERPLLALTTHPKMGSPVLGALKLGYRWSRRAASLIAPRD